jgi:predicted enzyme related to lactoylglutathione lyase
VVRASVPGMVTRNVAWPVWTTYLASADATATVAAAVGAGNSVLAAPFDVPDAGRMAVVADPVGATVANEVGALVWNELMCEDLPAAKAFYAAVFWHAHDDLPAGDYAMVTVVSVPTDTDYGRIAVVSDDHGAVLSLIQA